MRFAFLALVSMAAIGVAAPPDAPQPKPVPGIVFPVNPKQPVTPPAPQPTPGAVSKLAGDAAARSELFNPPDVLESKGGFAIYMPPPEVKAAEYVALDGEEPFPAALIGGSPTAFVFFTRGLPEKNYRFVGIASDAGGKLTRKQFVVPVGKPTTPPPVDKPPPVVDPPKDKKFYFMVVRPDGPATRQFTKAMEAPEWDALRKDGHTIKDFEQSAAVARVGSLPPGSSLPLVVILEGAEGNKVLAAVPFPTSGAGILDLPKGAK